MWKTTSRRIKAVTLAGPATKTTSAMSTPSVPEGSGVNCGGDAGEVQGQEGCK